MTLFECTPVSYFWNYLDKGHCINRLALFQATAATNTALDILILLLPVKMIWDLQLNMTKKLQLLFTFLLGTFVCIVSIIRLVAVTTQPKVITDPTTDEVGDITWATTEVYGGIISACLPTFRPILIKGNTVLSSLTSRISK
ncbi:hypothetical protein MMC14_002482 [Varicellaria rhodocarpa]|nr:hypothetical protein [Varicellaria rhodocarpa]